jgi:hypothetical protein
MATKSAKDTHRMRHGRPRLMLHNGLRPRPGSMAELGPGSGGVASLNHRLHAVIPPGWMGGCARGWTCSRSWVAPREGTWPCVGALGQRPRTGALPANPASRSPPPAPRPPLLAPRPPRVHGVCPTWSGVSRDDDHWAGEGSCKACIRWLRSRHRGLLPARDTHDDN